MRRLSAVFMLFLLFSASAFSADSGGNASEDTPSVDLGPVLENDSEAVPYGEDEFPQWAKDLRRGEIVSLGAMPFVGLWVAGGYGGYKYFSGKTDTFPNPFSSKDAFNKQEIWTMVGVTAGVGLGIGLTDFFVNLAKRKKAERSRLEQEARDRAGITPLTPEEAGELLRKNNHAGKETEE